MEKRQKDIDQIMKEVVAMVVQAKSDVIKRCLIEGHCYGYPHIDKEPRDNCIYCGEPRHDPNIWDIPEDIFRGIGKYE